MTLLVTVLGLLLGLLLATLAVTTAEAAPKVPPPKPVVKKLTPASGPVAGGTKVKIKGRHLTGAKKVLFGKVKGTKLKVKSDRKLTVVARPVQPEW